MGRSMVKLGHRELALALAILPLMITASLAAVLFKQSFDVGRSTDEIKMSVEQAEYQVVQLGLLREAVRKLEAAEDDKEMVLREKTNTVAAAVVSDLIDTIISRNGGDRIRINIADSINQTPYSQIVLRLDAEFRMQSLRDFLYEVENQPLLLTVRHLALRPVESSERSHLMHAEMTVIGYVKNQD